MFDGNAVTFCRQCRTAAAAALAEHLANAAVKTFPMAGRGRGGPLHHEDHPDSPRKIDLSVAAVIAFARASEAEHGSVYDARDVNRDPVPVGYPQRPPAAPC